MVSHDQITVKVHNFAKTFVESLNKKLDRYYGYDNETGIFDVAIYRLILEMKAQNVDWLDEKSRDKFFETIINDLNDLMLDKKIHVKMRNLGKIK